MFKAYHYEQLRYHVEQTEKLQLIFHSHITELVMKLISIMNEREVAAMHFMPERPIPIGPSFIDSEEVQVTHFYKRDYWTTEAGWDMPKLHDEVEKQEIQRLKTSLGVKK